MKDLRVAKMNATLDSFEKEQLKKLNEKVVAVNSKIKIQSLQKLALHDPTNVVSNQIQFQ